MGGTITVVYLWLKTIHLIGVVSWFAGLFYIVRLFVYHAEALAGDPARRDVLSGQYGIMEGRLYRLIMQPAMVVTVLAAVGMIALQPGLLGQRWMQAKLVLVVVLLAYHAWCGRTVKGFTEGRVGTSAQAFRVANEAPTLLLLGITGLAVFKASASLPVLAAVLTVMMVLLGVGIRVYARKRRQDVRA
jgi:putative membrane protein